MKTRKIKMEKKKKTGNIIVEDTRLDSWVENTREEELGNERGRNVDELQSVYYLHQRVARLVRC